MATTLRWYFRRHHHQVQCQTNNTGADWGLRKINYRVQQNAAAESSSSPSSSSTSAAAAAAAPYNRFDPSIAVQWLRATPSTAQEWVKIFSAWRSCLLNLGKETELIGRWITEHVTFLQVESDLQWDLWFTEANKNQGIEGVSVSPRNVHGNSGASSLHDNPPQLPW